MVSIHAPEWARHSFRNAWAAVLLVSIHAPEWGATIVATTLQGYSGVSIHAPAWGATWHHLRYMDVLAVSIHAPARGATDLVTVHTTAYQFQSTRPYGARRFDSIRLSKNGESVASRL